MLLDWKWFSRANVRLNLHFLKNNFNPKLAERDPSGKSNEHVEARVHCYQCQSRNTPTNTCTCVQSTSNGTSWERYFLTYLCFKRSPILRDRKTLRARATIAQLTIDERAMGNIFNEVGFQNTVFKVNLGADMSCVATWKGHIRSRHTADA